MKPESSKPMNRRTFMERSSQGAVALAALGSAPAVLSRPNPNEVIGVGHIGVGVRGTQLVQTVAGEPERGRPGVENVQVRAITEIYQPHLEKGIQLSGNSQAKRYHKYEEMLEDKDIDAVVIATPDHWHAQMVIDAATAGKDIYVEKCWTRTLPEAKAMLKTIKYNQTVMQLGHDRSSAAAVVAAELIRQGMLGEVTYVETGIFRNRPRGLDEWRWYGGYQEFNRPDENMVKENLDWARFLGNAPYHPFSMERFWHWRCYWDYGTGIAGDLLSHSFDFVQSVLKMGIPHSATCHGSINFLHDGRETPDTWNVIFHYPKQNMTLTYGATFNSMQQTDDMHTAEIRGKDAFMRVGHDDFEVYVEDQPKYQAELESGKASSDKPYAKFNEAEAPALPSHMEDFFNCMRTREKPRDNEDEAFIEAVACIMSVHAYFNKRTVTWDEERQEIV